MLFSKKHQDSEVLFYLNTVALYASVCFKMQDK